MKTYSNPRREATIEDWPSGRKRVTARFWIESNKRGERVCRVTTGIPKKSTYAKRCAIVDGDDGRTYLLHESDNFGHISVMRGDMKFAEESRFENGPGFSDLIALLDAVRPEPLPDTRYHYRGRIERPDGKGSYCWAEGWSRTAKGGEVEYPWVTKKEARQTDPGCKFTP